MGGHSMLFKALSAAVYGIDAHIIDVEVDYSGVVLERAEFSYGRASGCGGAGEPGPGAVGDPELGVRYAADADHDQSGSGGPEEGGVGVRSADCDWDSWGRMGALAYQGPFELPAGGGVGVGWGAAVGAWDAADCDCGEGAGDREPADSGGQCAGGGGGGGGEGLSQ